MFKDQAALSPFSPVYQSKPQELGGYFMSREDVIYHECAHFFLYSNLPEALLWLNEGFTEYFSSFAHEKNSIDISLPNRQNRPTTRVQTRAS